MPPGVRGHFPLGCRVRLKPDVLVAEGLPALELQGTVIGWYDTRQCVVIQPEGTTHRVVYHGRFVERVIPHYT